MWQQKFWDKVLIPFESSECWMWQAYRDKHGYGRFRKPGKNQVPAHRIAYQIAYGPVDQATLICHTCDTPPCVNPRHLFAGTPQDNMNDKIKKGRSNTPRGEQKTCKLSEAAVRELRKRYIPGVLSMNKLATEFGVDAETVRDVIRGKTWMHVGG